MIYKREIIDEIIKYVDLDEIIVLHGARQVGKSHILFWLEKYFQEKKQKTYFIDLEDSRFKRLLDSGVKQFIAHLKEEGVYPEKNSKTIIFIDEIQYLNNPSEFLKLCVDYHKNLKLIVSGSSSFEIRNKFKDSLVGRTINFEIFNLSFKEFLMFKNYSFTTKMVKSSIKIEELRNYFIEFVLYGAYPRIVLSENVELKEKRLQQIIDTYLRIDVRELANIENIEKFNGLIELLASSSGQMLNVCELANTCKLSAPTIEKYLFILEQTFIIKLVRPFHSNIRSELSKTPKVYFYDTGLLQMLSFKSLPKEVIGSIFETAVFAELVKKQGSKNIYYWRTKDKKEIDFISRLKNSLSVYETKLNFSKINMSAINYFKKSYEDTKHHIVSLRGSRRNKEDIYPWEI